MKPRHINLQRQGTSPCPFPFLEISLYFVGNLLERVSLSPANQTSLSIFGPCSDEPLLVQWFNHYIQGTFSPFPFLLQRKPLGTFTWQVLERLQKIPFGETISYSDVAASLKDAKAARAVGNACRVNPFPLIIPCHRVVQKTGHLGGFAFGTEMKKALLDFENQREFSIPSMDADSLMRIS